MKSFLWSIVNKELPQNDHWSGSITVVQRQDSWVSQQIQVQLLAVIPVMAGILLQFFGDNALQKLS